VSEAAVPFPWRQSRGVTARLAAPDAIASLASYGTEIRADGLARAERRLRSLSPEARSVVEALVARIIDEFVHVPAARLRAAGTSPEALVYAHVLQGLFGSAG
jgi:glutamyl-tRNA reductase